MIFKFIAVIKSTWAVTKVSLKKSSIWTHDLCHTSAVLYQLSLSIIKPTGSWSFHEFVMKDPVEDNQNYYPIY